MVAYYQLLSINHWFCNVLKEVNQSAISVTQVETIDQNLTYMNCALMSFGWRFSNKEFLNVLLESKFLDAGIHNENLTKGQWKKPPKLSECIEKCLLGF